MARVDPTHLLSAIALVVLVAGCTSNPEASSDGGGRGVTSPVGPQGSLTGTSLDSEMRARLEQIGDRVFFEYDKAELRPEGRELVQNGLPGWPSTPPPR